MAVVIDVTNPIELRQACFKAINDAYGYDVTRAFMDQCYGGSGDYTKEKYEYPEPSFEEYTAELLKIDAELRARGE